MEITIYADILFLVNMIADYLLLSLTAAFLRLSCSVLRMLIAAAFGAAYAIAVFFVPIPFFASPGARLALSAVLVITAFGAKNLRIFLKRLGVFYLISMALGGICFALLSATGIGSRLGAVYANGVMYINIPAYHLIAAAAVLYFILQISSAALKKAQGLCKVKLTYNTSRLSLCALYDTGNLLADPQSGLGVCIAEWDALRSLFPQSGTPFEAAEARPEIFTKISCRSIGGEEILYAFYAEINSEKRLIALTERHLDQSRQFVLILPNDFEGAKLNDGKYFKRHFYSGKIPVQLVKKLADRARHTSRKLLHKQRRGSSASSDL